MLQGLSKNGIKVPNGFAVTVEAFKYFISHNGIDKLIKKTIKKADLSSLTDLQIVGKKNKRSHCIGFFS